MPFSDSELMVLTEFQNIKQPTNVGDCRIEINWQENKGFGLPGLSFCAPKTQHIVCLK